MDASTLAAKSDLASLKAQIDEIDVGKLKTASIDLSELSDAANNDVVKKSCE